MKPQMNIDLKNTTMISDNNGKPLILQEAVLLRKVSKFVLGSSEDGILPIPVMIDMESKKIYLEMLPKELREEYKEYGI